MRGLILLHRYLGIALSVLFVVWFASGITMIYTGGMPGVNAAERVARLPPLDLERVRITPGEALEKALLGDAPERVVLTTVMGRPAYRFGTPPVTVFADNGDDFFGAEPAEARRVASQFSGLPESSLQHASTLTRADQWTLLQRSQMPIHKFVANDDAGTEIYVSEPYGDVVVATTRRTRTLAWLGAIPHWFYFESLRRNDSAWRQTVLWTSGVGCVLALLGIIVALLRLRVSRPVGFARLRQYVPYSGWMFWHYVTGLVFGLFAATWAFSGMLSMEPFFWASSAMGTVSPATPIALAGGALDVAQFRVPSASQWQQTAAGAPITQLEFVRVQGEPHFLVSRAGASGASTTPAAGRLLAAESLAPRDRPLDPRWLADRVLDANPHVSVTETTVLNEYDDYYYARDGARPLPVLRLKFDDPMATWLYVDLTLGRVVGSLQRLERLQRWIYNGLHSLDFSFWYSRRPLWDAGVIALCVGGFATSAIGVWLGFGRLVRTVRRTAVSAPSAR